MLTIKKVFSSALILSTLMTSSLASADVNIYSYRQEFLIRPLLDAFTEKTGIKANVVFAKSGLVERLKHEGRNTPADLILTSDIAPLFDAKSADLLQPINSEIVKQRVPQYFRDQSDQWIGLTTRSRIIYTSKTRVAEGEITRYEDLTDPKWQGRICTRSGKHSYNLSLIGSMIVHQGEAATETWLAGLKNNLARKPQGNDRAQVKAIFQGECDVALGNSYYFGAMVTNTKEPEQKQWADSVNLIFPNQMDRGAHMNISGVGLTLHSQNKAQALQLIEFLTSDEAQRIYAEVNFEFPVVDNVSQSDFLNQYMGEFKGDKVSLTEVAEQRAKAAKLVDRIGFDL